MRRAPPCPSPRFPAFGRGIGILALAVAGACDGSTGIEPAPIQPPTFRIPVVVHVIHAGEPIGSGDNLPEARIKGQIRSLNDDYRRLAGTRGHNAHPSGADSQIEFVLASVAPDGTPTDGIVRVDTNTVSRTYRPNSMFDNYAEYSYWDPERYVNIWTMPLPGSTVDIILGLATGPETDLPGGDLLFRGEPFQAEGILINSAHFGQSNRSIEYNLGRTLTHEMGHYLGLLHTWGAGDCTENDYCDDTPPVAGPIRGCPNPAPLGCTGEPVMIENYMNYTRDSCMNMFTNDQVARMHYVLTHSPRRAGLPYSPGLGDS